MAIVAGSIVCIIFMFGDPKTHTFRNPSVVSPQSQNNFFPRLMFVICYCEDSVAVFLVVRLEYINFWISL